MAPLQFHPILKSTLWGGERLTTYKHLDHSPSPTTHHPSPIGESWEISAVPGSESVVADGEYKGQTLTEVIRQEKGNLTGTANYRRFGDEFPLLIKFIDAAQDLSIQVHPDDATARRQGLQRGKTEMWYIIDSTPDAKLYSGLRQKITPEEYTRLVADDRICDALAQHSVHPGDVFFLPAGRIHSIGAGCLLAEIQQTSDTTYRIYDFNRRDSQGNLRQLHTRQAAESIDYTVYDDYRTNYIPHKDECIPLVDCPYFTTALYDLTEPMMIDYTELDSFVVLMAVGGEGQITTDEGDKLPLRSGQTVLLPATTKTIYVEGQVKLIETFIP